MAETILETEAIPESYPKFTPSDDLEESNFDHIWQRLEAYVSERWTPRQVMYHVLGDGEWTPRLRPFTIKSVESFWNGEWKPSDHPPNAFGGLTFLVNTTHRVKCEVGANNQAPEIVTKAAKRLADYLVYLSDHATRPNGASRMEVNFADGQGLQYADGTTIHSLNINRDPNWIAKAMVQSGAADLLRGYRGLA